MQHKVSQEQRQRGKRNGWDLCSSQYPCKAATVGSGHRSDSVRESRKAISAAAPHRAVAVGDGRPRRCRSALRGLAAARGAYSPRSREALKQSCSGLVPRRLICRIALLLPAASCRRLLSYAPLPRPALPLPCAREPLHGGAGWDGALHRHQAISPRNPSAPPDHSVATPSHPPRRGRCRRFGFGAAARPFQLLPLRAPALPRSGLGGPDSFPGRRWQ